MERCWRHQWRHSLRILCAATVFCAGASRVSAAEVSPSAETSPAEKPAEQPVPLARGIVAHAVVLAPRANGASLALELSGDAPYRVTTMARPDRIIIDLPRVAFAPAQGKPLTKTGPVAAFRYGLFIADRSRVVLDLAEPALLDRVDTADIDGRKRLIFHFSKADRAKFAEAARKDAGVRDMASVPLPPSETVRGAKPLVVIDPGHGGIDGGAAAADGAQEKTIVFALAQAVKERLEQGGKVNVAMTRSDDSFVSLGDRVKFARDRKADLMVSLHADKLVYEKGVRGASVYTLSEKASDVISARLAASENASDDLAGVQQSEDSSVVGDILFDLTKRETRMSSVGFARGLTGSLTKATAMHKSALRAAGFKVLTAPDVPSVLIETGYLSSTEEARLMRTDEWRKGMGDAIASAIEKFLGENATRVTNSASRP